MNRPTPEKPNLEEVKAFVKKNIIKSRQEEIRCGDGRPTPEQSDGAVRAFGEDFGMMLAIEGALWIKGNKEIDDEKLIDSYLTAVKSVRGENPKLFAHTDSHAEKDGGIGCGHARLTSSPESNEEYIVPASRAASLYSAILRRENLDMQVLDGNHGEQGVLLVRSQRNSDGKRFSVNSKDKDGKSSFFVVDMDGIREHFELIVPQISKELGVELTAEEAMEAYEKQQAVSAEKLEQVVGPLTFYNVDINDSGESSVKKI